MLASNKKNASILVVDDDLTMRILMHECLEPLGYKIIQASNGLNAIEEYEKHHPDMILMDVQMPIMSGFTACRKLRALPECATVPILIITGLDDFTSIEEAYNVGATDFITKPIDWLVLQHRVRYMLRASEAFEAIRKQEASLARAQRIAKLGNWELNLKTNTLEWSDETYRIFEISKENTTLSLDVFNNAIHPEDRSLVENAFLSSLNNRLPYRVTHRIVLPDGSIKHVEEQGAIYYDKDDNPEKSIGTVQDITEQVHTSKKIQTLSQAVEQSPVSVMITDFESHIEYTNHAFVKNTGYQLKDSIHKHASLLNSELTNRRILQNIGEAVSSGSTWHGELQVKRKDGTHFWARSNIAPVFDDSKNITNYLYIAEDITLYKQQEEKILYQAHFDALTQLPNRFLVLDRLLQSIKEAHRYNKKVAILFLDLDDFKKVNDSLGHEVGDKILVVAASRLARAVRSQDTVGRHGGDEFIVILGDLDDEHEAIPIAETILQQFREEFELGRRKFVLTSSIGISIYPNDGIDPAELLRKADTAMYKSKEEGKNTFCFITEEMNKGVARRILLEEQLRGALNRNEFSILYQPLINTSSENIMGAEALLRWKNDIVGQVSPNEFIPITEQLGLIITIGRYVLKEALEFAKIHRDNFSKDFSISVNVSPVQFRDPELPAYIDETLRALNLPGSALSLEVTEGVLLSGHRHITEAITAMDDLGIKISMDDFGTGYSSFNYLRNYPFSILKIDRSFISGIDLLKNDYKIVGSIISMARGLGLTIIAEGVETAQQLECLQKLNCDLIQGYYFSRPLTQDDFSIFIETWKK